MKYAAQEESFTTQNWLGELPDGWVTKRLKYVSTINDETLPETVDPDYELLYVDIGSVDATEGIQKKEPMIFETAPSRARRIVQDGDTILSTVRTYLRAVAPIQNPEENLIVSTGFAVIRPKGIDPHYLSYSLRSSYFIETVVSRSVGVSYPATNPTDVSCIELPLPSVDEQQTIARFLDAKTAQIDALLAQKRQLIAKLKEKRSALIARTVTRGLPPEAAKAAGLEPNPEMRSAEVEWLDEYPCAWSLIPLKHLAAIKYGIGEPPEYVDDGVPLIRATNVDAGFIREKGLVSVNPLDIPAKRIVWLCEGDIIVVRSGAYTADSACIPAEFAGSIAGFDMVVSPRKIESRFLAYAVLSRYFKEGQLDIQKMRAAQPHLNAEELGSSAVCVPPELEQSLIADFLNRETAQIDQLIELAEGVIQSTTEYRQALITSAVTGKIDVRGLA